MSRKSKGISGERELIHGFWSKKWAACRIAGSGSSVYPSPDVIAGNGSRTIAIEAKICSNNIKYFTKQEISDLLKFCRIFGAEAWVAIKFKKEAWLFMNLEDLEEKEESFAVSVEVAKRRGLLLEEVVGQKNL